MNLWLRLSRCITFDAICDNPLAVTVVFGGVVNRDHAAPFLLPQLLIAAAGARQRHGTGTVSIIVEVSREIKNQSSVV